MSLKAKQYCVIKLCEIAEKLLLIRGFINNTISHYSFLYKLGSLIKNTIICVSVCGHYLFLIPGESAPAPGAGSPVID